MVSIPDWSRLQRLGDFPVKETTLPQSRYYKQREEETIKQAEEQGYFLNPCRHEILACKRNSYIKFAMNYLPITLHSFHLFYYRSFLEREFFPNEEEDDILAFKLSGERKTKERDLSQIFLLKLPISHLRTVGDIGLCSNLTICILSNNYITRFDSLVGCLFLMKLDLHSNQVGLV